MSDEISVFAPAKLNLCLRVLRRRSDGYHDLQTAYELLDFGDTVTVRRRDDGLIRRNAPVPGVSEDDDLTLLAARLLQRAAGVSAGADITLTKLIPPGSGLGGGSSDAAAALLALNRLWKLDWPREQLRELALELGADVPVFVLGRSAWAEGIGERLSPLALPRRHYVVVVPAVAASTARVFGALELTGENPPIKIPDFLAGESAERLCNDLQGAACAIYPDIDRALRWLAQFAPSSMSGSGSAVFAAVTDEHTAHAVLAELPARWFGFAARSLDADSGSGSAHGLSTGA